MGRQYRVTINGVHHRVDLVFYHRILRCFVLIDLKLGEVQHHDIGQMNLYLGYFANEENVEGDNPQGVFCPIRHNTPEGSHRQKSLMRHGWLSMPVTLCRTSRPPRSPTGTSPR